MASHTAMSRASPARSSAVEAPLRSKHQREERSEEPDWSGFESERDHEAGRTKSPGTQTTGKQMQGRKGAEGNDAKLRTLSREQLQRSASNGQNEFSILEPSESRDDLDRG